MRLSPSFLPHPAISSFTCPFETPEHGDRGISRNIGDTIERTAVGTSERGTHDGLSSSSVSAPEREAALGKESALLKAAVARLRAALREKEDTVTQLVNADHIHELKFTLMNIGRYI